MLVLANCESRVLSIKAGRVVLLELKIIFTVTLADLYRGYWLVDNNYTFGVIE